jgi:hypothetical protein
MDPRRLLGLALFGFFTFATGRDLYHDWRRPVAIFLGPLFPMLLVCLLRFVFISPAAPKDQLN